MYVYICQYTYIFIYIYTHVCMYRHIYSFKKCTTNRKLYPNKLPPTHPQIQRQNKKWPVPDMRRDTQYTFSICSPDTHTHTHTHTHNHTSRPCREISAHRGDTHSQTHTFTCGQYTCARLHGNSRGGGRPLP